MILKFKKEVILSELKTMSFSSSSFIEGHKFLKPTNSYIDGYFILVIAGSEEENKPRIIDGVETGFTILLAFSPSVSVRHCKHS